MTNIFKKNTSSIITLLMVVVFLFSFFFQTAQAAPDNELTYHGKLTNTDNVAVANGTYNFTISIYDAPSGGNRIWTARGTAGAPTAKSLTVTNGIFSTTLGESGDNTLENLTFSENYYLGITIGTNAEMTPRRKVTPTGFALNSHRLNGQTEDYYLNTSATAQTKLGNLAINGNFAVNGALNDSSGDAGTIGQILSSTASGTNWINPSVDTLSSLTCVNGQVAQWNGTAWVCAVSGANNDWTVSGNDMHSTVSGNVGIGTTTPDYKLQVNGDIVPETNNTHGLGTTALRWKDLYLGSNALHIGENAANEVTIGYNATKDALEFSKSTSIAGSIQLTNDTATCSTAKEGSMRYNDTTKVMEFCNGTTWGGLTSGSGGSGTNYSFISGGWTNTGSALPGNLIYSQTAVIGDYVYLFGGNSGGGNGGTYTNVIYRAPVSDPTSWTNTGSTLPSNLGFSQTAVIGDYVYLFGGYNGSTSTNVIYRAPVSDPTSWTNTGSTLPNGLHASQTAVIGDYVYLFGGRNGSAFTNVIYRAPVSDPTSWTNTGSTLPSILGFSQTAVIGDYVYLFGGQNGAGISVIYRAPVSDPTSWTNTGSTIPVVDSQVAVIGDYVYLFGGYKNVAYTNGIYRAPVSDPTSWTNTGSTLPSNLGFSQTAVIGDYVYLFGGHNGSAYTSVIYRAKIDHGQASLASNRSWKVKFTNATGNNAALPTCTNGQTLSYNATSSTWICADSISSNGNPISFQVIKTATQVVAIGNVVTWDTETEDNGSSFDLVNNKFIAPQDGTYYLHADILTSNGYAGDYRIYKNGVNTKISGYGSLVNGFKQTTLSTTITLQAGDEITINCGPYSAQDVFGDVDYHTRFSGFLVNGSVSLPTCTNGQTLSYNATSSTWICADAVSGGGSGGEETKFLDSPVNLLTVLNSPQGTDTGWNTIDISSHIGTDTASHAIVSVDIRGVDADTIGTYRSDSLAMRKTGNTNAQVTAAWTWVDSNNNTNGGGHRAQYIVPVDSAGRFDYRWIANLTNSNNLDVYLEGYKTHSTGTATGTSLWATVGSNINYMAGNVGIGTTTPAEKLAIYGNGQIVNNITDAGGRGDMLSLTSATTDLNSGGAILFGNSQSKAAGSLGMAAIKANLTNGSGNTTGDLTFLTRGLTTDTSLAERMRITWNGKVGIGTSTPTSLLEVENSLGEAYVTTDGAAGSNSGVQFMENGVRNWLTYTQGNNDRYYILDADGTNYAYLDQNATAWGFASDERLKEHVSELSVLSRLQDYRAVSFDWISTGINDVGVIAQELYQSFPEAVNKGSDSGDLTSATDPGAWGVEYSKLGVFALQGVKELSNIVTENSNDLTTKANADSVSELQVLVDNQFTEVSALFASTQKDAKDDETLRDDILSLQDEANDQSNTIDDIKKELSEAKEDVDTVVGVLNTILDGSDVTKLSALLAIDADTIMYKDDMNDLTLTGITTVGTLKADTIETNKISIKTKKEEDVSTEKTKKEEDVSTASAGTVSIKKGEKQIEVKTDAFTTKSKVFVTATTEMEDNTFYVDKNYGDKSFTIILDHAFKDEDKESIFDWFILGVTE